MSILTLSLLTLFLSTLSLRRATVNTYHRIFGEGDYFYPRSPCGERRVYVSYNMYNNTLSIHALLAESDMIHPRLCSVKLRFLSTLSLRRATLGSQQPAGTTRNFYPRSPCGERRACLSACVVGAAYFYPRSPCGERLAWNRFTQRRDFISIHALLAESDLGRGEVV